LSLNGASWIEVFIMIFLYDSQIFSRILQRFSIEKPFPMSIIIGSTQCLWLRTYSSGRIGDVVSSNSVAHLFHLKDQHACVVLCFILSSDFCKIRQMYDFYNSEKLSAKYYLWNKFKLKVQKFKTTSAVYYF
jgi:hypothetical protein